MKLPLATALAGGLVELLHLDGRKLALPITEVVQPGTERTLKARQGFCVGALGLAGGGGGFMKRRCLEVTRLKRAPTPSSIAPHPPPKQMTVAQGEGMPVSREPGKRGDLKVVFDVTLPHSLSPAQKEAIRHALA